MSGHACGDCGCAVWKQSPVPEYPACPHDKRGEPGPLGPTGIPELLPWQTQLLKHIEGGEKFVIWMSPRPSHQERVDVAAAQLVLHGLEGRDREVVVFGVDNARNKAMAKEIYDRAAEMLEWLHER